MTRPQHLWLDDMKHEHHDIINIVDEDGNVIQFEDPYINSYKKYLEDGKVLRYEFALTHKCHGQIIYYDNTGVVRAEFGPTHKRHGYIISYKNGVKARLEFAPTHKHHGEIICFKNNERVSAFYEEHHEAYGEFAIFKDGKLDRIEYNKTHEDYGSVLFYKHGCLDRMEYKQTHLQYGQVLFYKHDCLDRIEYIPAHPLHGKILFINHEQERSRIEFASTHKNHGEIWFYEKKELTRRVYNGITFYPQSTIILGDDYSYINIIEFGPKHRHAGETWHFYKSFHIRTDYGPDHIKHGEDCCYPDMNGPYNYSEQCENLLSMREFDEWLDQYDMKLKHELHKEELAKEGRALELQRRKSIAAQRDEKRGEQPLPFTERGMPNSGKLKTKTSVLTEVDKIIREVNKNESLSRLYREKIKKHENAVQDSKRVLEQEVALQTANAILYCK